MNLPDRGGSLYRSPLPVPKMKKISLFTLPAYLATKATRLYLSQKDTFFMLCIDWVKLYSYRSYDKAF